MLNNPLISAITGLLLGFLSGLGVGGGSLLILWLTLVIGMEPQQARAINLMFFITAAGSVSLFRWKNKALDFRPILPAILCGCIAAAVFSWMSRYIQTDTLKKLFGILLLITGIRELLYRPREFK